LRFVTNGAEAGVFDSSGNLGLGVTPSAWASSWKVFQSQGGFVGSNATSGYFISNNSYSDGTNWRRVSAEAASQYLQSAGAHAWLTAGSSTAGSTISFTQAMTLDANGYLGIGTTNPSASAARLVVSKSSGVIASFTNDVDADFQIQTGTATTTIGSTTSTPLIFKTGNTERLRLDSSGSLGLGVTPSAWGSAYKALDVNTRGLSLAGGTESGAVSVNAYWNSGWKYAGTSTYRVSQYQQFDGAHTWYTAPSGTAGAAISFTQAMTLDASGNLLVGTTTAAWAAAGRGLVEINGSSSFLFGGKVGGTQTAYFAGSSGGAEVATTTSTPLIFTTNNTERARITAGGFFKASNTGTYAGSTGTYHELYSNVSNAEAVIITNAAASNPYGPTITFSAAAPNDATRWFLNCGDNAATRAVIRSNGGLANYQSNNVDLSDARTKKDIAPAASMWDKIGALEIVTYKYNDQTHDDVNVGVIAQQVESVEPVWVDADGFGETPEGEEPLKTVYTKDITFAAIKALQEAMARIEKLEAEVSALKGA
jgi:hypothetical protein